MPKKDGLAILIAAGKPKGGGPPEGSDEEEAAESPEEEAAETQYPEFDVPEGLDLSDMKTGDEKEVLATIRKTDSGACLVKVDGVDLESGESSPPAEEAAPDESAGIPPPPGPPGAGPGAAVAQRAMGAGLM